MILIDVKQLSMLLLCKAPPLAKTAARTSSSANVAIRSPTAPRKAEPAVSEEEKKEVVSPRGKAAVAAATPAAAAPEEEKKDAAAPPLKAREREREKQKIAFDSRMSMLCVLAEQMQEQCLVMLSFVGSISNTVLVTIHSEH